TVDEIVRHREREVTAQGTWLRVRRVRRADRRSRGCDRAFALEHEGERWSRADEVDELAEERLLLVLGVVRLAELARRDEQARGAQRQAAPLEAREDLAGEAAFDRVGLREDERAFDGHRRETLARLLRGARRTRRALGTEGDGLADARLAVRAYLPRRLERARALRARLAQLRRADRADEEVDLHL